MQKKLTISIDEKVYTGLYEVIGRRNISRFIESLVKPHVYLPNLDKAYMEMSTDEKRELEALEWSKLSMETLKDEPR